jgi:hypothetical protein
MRKRKDAESDSEEHEETARWKYRVFKKSEHTFLIFNISLIRGPWIAIGFIGKSGLVEAPYGQIKLF